MLLSCSTTCSWCRRPSWPWWPSWRTATRTEHYSTVVATRGSCCGVRSRGTWTLCFALCFALYRGVPRTGSSLVRPARLHGRRLTAISRLACLARGDAAMVAAMVAVGRLPGGRQRGGSRRPATTPRHDAVPRCKGEKARAEGHGPVSAGIRTPVRKDCALFMFSLTGMIFVLQEVQELSKGGGAALGGTALAAAERHLVQQAVLLHGQLQLQESVAVASLAEKRAETESSVREMEARLQADLWELQDAMKAALSSAAPGNLATADLRAAKSRLEKAMAAPCHLVRGDVKAE